MAIIVIIVTMLILSWILYALKEIAVKLIAFIACIGFAILLISWGPTIINGIFSLMTTVFNGLVKLAIAFPIASLIMIILIILLIWGKSSKRSKK